MFACPECGKKCRGAQGVGAHRYFRHGVQGTSNGRAKGDIPPEPDFGPNMRDGGTVKRLLRMAREHRAKALSLEKMAMRLRGTNGHKVRNA